MFNTIHRRTAVTHSGFTLIELMITCTILAIIVGVAVPAYTSEIRKSRRSEARNIILDLAGREERYLSTQNTYSSTPTDVGYPGVAWVGIATLDGYYSLNVTSPDSANQAGVTNTFLITATAAGQQANDTPCASFTVNQLGQQKAYTSAAVDNTTTCWKN